MRARRLLSVTLLGIGREKTGFALSAGGVAVGVAAFVFFVGLGEGVSSVVREQIFPVDTSHLKVVPQRVALGSFLGGGVLDDDAVERLSSLPGVEEAFRLVDLRVPAVSRYDGDFFGRRVRMGVDILAVGVDSEYLAEHLSRDVRFSDPGPVASTRETDERAEVVPAVISRRLLEVYNTTFAPARGLPRLDESQLIGFRFPVTLGASFISRTGAVPRRTVTLKVVGFSERGLLLGVTLPLETVRRWNSKLLADSDENGESYSSVVLVADGPDRVGELVSGVRAAGFEVDQTEQRLADEIGAAIKITTLTLSLLALVILALAAVSIARGAHARVAARTREIGVMRAVGGTRADVASIVLAESLAAGLLGGLIGLAMAWAASLGTDLLVSSLVVDFPFKPESFFVFPPWLPASAVGAALGAAFIGALLPALKAARLDPVKALSGGG